MPFNPLVDSFNTLTDSEIDVKVQELSRKYWQTSNPSVQMQISNILDMYRDEQSFRQAKAYRAASENNESGLDSLINVS